VKGSYGRSNNHSPMSNKEAVIMVGRLMELAARTAPKAMGKDFIETVLLTDEQRVKLGEDLISIGKERGIPGYQRDGQNVLDSDAVVLVGLLPHLGVGLDCGACGVSGCAEFNTLSASKDFQGPNCALRLLDLGIALGSAAKVASDHNVDNRIMYRIGVSAIRLGYSRSNICHGIPLSATGKNIFFDRGR
jgi:uncharacterized ferredoxin-like protein